MNEPTFFDRIKESRFLKYVAMATLLLVVTFFAGIIHGYTETHVEHGGGLNSELVLIYAFCLSVIALAGYAIYRLAKALTTPRTPQSKPLLQTKTGRTRLTWIVLIISGVIIGALGSSLTNGDPSVLISPEGTLAPTIAIGLSLALLFLLLVGTVFYRRNIDELELHANYEGAYWAISFYTMVMPIGWLLEKANIIDNMPVWPIYCATITIASVIFFWKRFR